MPVLAVTDLDVIYYRGQPGSTAMPIPSSGDEIEDEILDRIESGVYPPGSRLPSTPELAREFGVSDATIYRVVRRLRLAGDLVGRPGNGVFVAED